MMKEIYLSVDWDSRSISVSTKKDWEEYREEGIDDVWKNIVKKINEIDSGWEYKEFVNDGKVGMRKVYRE